MNSIPILVLAAGKSSRMKDIKQLIKIENKYLLDITLQKAKTLNPEMTFCVLGANYQKIKQQVKTKNINFIYNSSFEEGLSTSIISGINFLENNFQETEGVFIMLADQPEISDAYLKDLINLFNRDTSKIIATKYKNTIGVPCIFPKKYFSDLKKIKGDKGAKKLLEKLEKNIIFSKINTNFVDLDTPEDVLKYNSK